jgi:hypothetical protein
LTANRIRPFLNKKSIIKDSNPVALRSKASKILDK